jgi:dCTP deaminase
MILTGSEISKMRAAGRITIEPYLPDQINPNSYNYRLGPRLGVPVVDGDKVSFDFIDIPEEGYQLEPHTMYLGHTLEELGSDTFAMRLIGRSSLGRFGLFLQVSADLGHTGSSHQWTLEIVAAKPIILYPNMRIGQISFWENFGRPSLYRDGYSSFNAPTVSKFSSAKMELGL